MRSSCLASQLEGINARILLMVCQAVSPAKRGMRKEATGPFDVLLSLYKYHAPQQP